MTVKSDLEKAIASAQAAKGSYMMAAEATDDPTAQQKYKDMATDMDTHLGYLSSRVQYMNSTNAMNSTMSAMNKSQLE